VLAHQALADLVLAHRYLLIGQEYPALALLLGGGDTQLVAAFAFTQLDREDASVAQLDGKRICFSGCWRPI
jgi:hypothetical protein